MRSRPTKDLTHERFLHEVEKHEMTIYLDEGINRRIRFAIPDSFNRSFTIITAPGVLIYYGDMGSYVFQRLEDMFEFFREPDGRDPKYRINPQYWGEKVIAEDRNCKMTRFSEAAWEEAVRHDVKSYLESYADDGEGKWFKMARVIWPAVKEEVLGRGASDAREAIEAAMNFSVETPYEGVAHSWPDSITKDRPKKHRPFSDFYEHGLEEYSYHFTWCCYALVWAIDKYDASKEKKTNELNT